MTYRIEGWVIIDSRDGSRWGGLYESETGAKQSWNKHCGIQDGQTFGKKIKFNEQQIYILNPLVLIEGETK